MSIVDLFRIYDCNVFFQLMLIYMLKTCIFTSLHFKNGKRDKDQF